MKIKNTRRGFTQIERADQALSEHASVKGHRSAFTLIELLVVVLIIGILAAVAVPQYRKAVIKSRFAEALTHLKAIAEADQVCQINKGKTCNFDELDVEIGKRTDPKIRETDNFLYYPSAQEEDLGTENVVAYAVYQKEDVCLCYMKNGEILIKQNDSCLGDETSFDYAKLLGIPEDSSCYCC